MVTLVKPMLPFVLFCPEMSSICWVSFYCYQHKLTSFQVINCSTNFSDILKLMPRYKASCVFRLRDVYFIQVPSSYSLCLNEPNIIGTRTFDCCKISSYLFNTITFIFMYIILTIVMIHNEFKQWCATTVMQSFLSCKDTVKSILI